MRLAWLGMPMLVFPGPARACDIDSHPYPEDYGYVEFHPMNETVMDRDLQDGLWSGMVRNTTQHQEDPWQEMTRLGSRATELDLSDDGNLLAMATPEGIVVHDFTTDENTVPMSMLRFDTVRFAGDYLAGGSNVGLVHLWNDRIVNPEQVQI